jgi:hypothetical protein
VIAAKTRAKQLLVAAGTTAAPDPGPEPEPDPAPATEDTARMR